MIRNLKTQRLSGKLIIGTSIVSIFILIAITAPLLSPQIDPNIPSNFKVVGKPYDINPYPPSPGIPLGTTPGQFDIFHTLVWCTRTALTFGLTITLSTALFGVVLGAISGYYRGKLGNLILRITETFLGFPIIASIVVINSFYASQVSNFGMSLNDSNFIVNILINNDIHPVMLSLIAFSWMPYVKLTYSSSVAQMEEEYVRASISIGVSPLRVIFKHVLPNIFYPILVLVAKSVGGFVVLDAGLTYIGISGATE